MSSLKNPFATSEEKLLQLSKNRELFVYLVETAADRKENIVRRMLVMISKFKHERGLVWKQASTLFL